MFGLDASCAASQKKDFKAFVGECLDHERDCNLIRYIRQAAVVCRVVEPTGLEPVLLPCKGSVLPN